LGQAEEWWQGSLRWYEGWWREEEKGWTGPVESMRVEVVPFAQRSILDFDRKSDEDPVELHQSDHHRSIAACLDERREQLFAPMPGTSDSKLRIPTLFTLRDFPIYQSTPGDRRRNEDIAHLAIIAASMVSCFDNRTGAIVSTI
jgi:hypothetical protein